MTGRVLRFVATAGDAAAPSAGVETIVLDTTWTPLPGDREDLRPLRPFVRQALRRHDPLAEALSRLDAWAAASDTIGRLELDGTSLWYRRRLVHWRALHDRLIWRWVLGLLAAEGPISGLVLTTDLPDLHGVGSLLAAASGWTYEAPPPVAPSLPARRRLPWPIDPILWRLGVHPALRGRPAGPDPAIAARRTAAIRDRIRWLGQESGRLLVLTSPTTHQAIATDGAGASTGDPFLGPVVDTLRGTPLEPIVVELGGGTAADDGAWADLEAPGRERVLPGWILARAFADPADDARSEPLRRQAEGRLAEPFAPLDADGIDLAPLFVTELRDYVETGLAADLRQVARIRRFLAAVRPAAVLTINEYSRPEWLVAADREGIPVVAVQHGIIHPLHAGYVLPSRRGLPLASRTHLFGPYEARLLTGTSVYRPDEVVVSGAPRLDLVRGEAADAARRAAVRAGLGVGLDERMVVFSSTSSEPVRATIIAAAFDAILDRSWPGVHLVVKLHPAEADDGFYPALIDGIAAARGFAPPPTTVVKSIDLFELLRAADAHLGVHSTVLTDAVAAGTPNLIVTSIAGSDLIGYVDAGVAQPVADGADLLAALDALAAPETSAASARARAAFLADHFAPGPSARRIADDLVAGLGRPVEPGPDGDS